MSKYQRWVPWLVLALAACIIHDKYYEYYAKDVAVPVKIKSLPWEK